jgi:ribosomal protein L35
MGSKALIKTNKAAAKRMRVRGGGSIKRNRAGNAHNTGYKKRSRSNRLGTSCGIKGAAIEKRMRRLIN